MANNLGIYPNLLSKKQIKQFRTFLKNSDIKFQNEPDIINYIDNITTKLLQNSELIRLCYLTIPNQINPYKTFISNDYTSDVNKQMKYMKKIVIKFITK